MGYEVEIPREYIRRGVRFFLWGLALIGLVLLGRSATPVSSSGKLVLLSPRLAQISVYQRAAQGWTDELSEIQSGLAAILDGQSTDLLTLDGQANGLYGRLINLQAEVDGTRVPPTLDSLHENLLDAVDSTAGAALLVSAWVSEPTEENLNVAEDALDGAADLLDRLEQNPWLQGAP